VALKRRLIARLDIKAPNLIKQIRMEGLKVVGDPNEYARKYNVQGIDEIIFIDTVASLYGRNALDQLVSDTSQDVFCPLTVGGGIRSTEDATRLFNAGADKIAVNTQALKTPEFLTELAEKFGSQAVVLQIDAKRVGSKYVCWTDGGREPADIGVLQWAKKVERLGAGEILLTSIDNEGTRKGFNTKLIRDIATQVSLPVVASGGMGAEEHAITAFASGADAIAMAHVLHYDTVKLNDIRKYVKAAGFPVRDEPLVLGPELTATDVKRRLEGK
jgi:cyclase